MLNYWDVSLDDTVRTANRVVRRVADAPDALDTADVTDWLAMYNEASPTSSNQGAGQLPFQRWFRFKEAFSPKFVTDTIGSLPHPVDRCIDPFAGSGTTSLTCDFLGIDSISLEVNPFLADLVSAKITPLSPSSILHQYEQVIADIDIITADQVLPTGMPRTMREPGLEGRWIFESDVYDTIRALVRRLEDVPPAERRLLRVLLGSVLVANSNVLINGKGRRYRRNWRDRKRSVKDLLDDLDTAVDVAVADISRYPAKTRAGHEIKCGDARQLLQKVDWADLAIFSPPYPNSFDYTDVYNLELWMLGYLGSSHENRQLRLSTLRSHVQATWESAAAVGSTALSDTLVALEARRADLWNRGIPGMVACYFEDMRSIMTELARILAVGRHTVIAIGDSQYAGVHIDVAEIICEMSEKIGFNVVGREAIRSMRNSSQHGGAFELREHCLVLERG